MAWIAGSSPAMTMGKVGEFAQAGPPLPGTTSPQRNKAYRLPSVLAGRVSTVHSGLLSRCSEALSYFGASSAANALVKTVCPILRLQSIVPRATSTP